MRLQADVLLPFNLGKLVKMCFCCFKRSMKQTVRHLSDRSLYDWAIQFRAIASVLKKRLNRSGEGHSLFYIWPGEGHNFFLVFKWRVRIFLGAMFKKLVALPPQLNNDTSLYIFNKHERLIW